MSIPTEFAVFVLGVLIVVLGALGRVTVRVVDPYILAGVVLLTVGVTGMSWSLYNQRPTPSGESADSRKADIDSGDFQARLRAWEAEPSNRVWRMLWPPFLVVSLAGLAGIVYAWNNWINGRGRYARTK